MHDFGSTNRAGRQHDFFAMSLTHNHLHLILNESGKDPLVLKARWEGVPNRPAPDILDVKQAKPRLRALCILLLLAKFDGGHGQAGQRANSSGTLDYGTGPDENSWVHVLGHAVKKTDLLGWLMKLFHIQEDEIFMLAHPGGASVPGAKKGALSQYYSQILPTDHLHFSTRPNYGLKPKVTLLEGEKLVLFARKLEKLKNKSWTRSPILERYPELFPDELAPSAKPAGIEKKDSDAMLQAYFSDAVSETGDAPTSNSEGLYELLYRILTEKAYDVYRERCAPFYNYLAKSPTSPKMPLLWQRRDWNRNQVYVLWFNFRHYANESLAWMEFLATHGDLSDPELNEAVWGKYGRSSSYVLVAVEEALHDLERNVERRSWSEFGKFLIPENFRLSERTRNGLKSEDFPTMMGTLFAQQIAMVDFLGEICLPLVPCFMEHEFWSPEETAGNLAGGMLRLRIAAAKNQEFMRRGIISSADLLKAAQTTGSLLKAQADFWEALYHKVIVLER